MPLVAMPLLDGWGLARTLDVQEALDAVRSVRLDDGLGGRQVVDEEGHEAQQDVHGELLSVDVVWWCGRRGLGGWH
jgi:hypothetical protein